MHKILLDSIQHAVIAGWPERRGHRELDPSGSAPGLSVTLSVAEAEAVLKAANGTRLETCLALSLMTGIRARRRERSPGNP